MRELKLDLENNSIVNNTRAQKKATNEIIHKKLILTAGILSILRNCKSRTEPCRTASDPLGRPESQKNIYFARNFVSMEKILYAYGSTLSIFVIATN